MARIYYRKMKWTMPLLHDNYAVKRSLGLLDDPSTVIIGPDLRVAFTFNEHTSEQEYLTRISGEIEKLLK
ncbi:hypothetical protein JXO52_09250 [bacterium]|nr:hypothetical protein [bacterium]